MGQIPDQDKAKDRRRRKAVRRWADRAVWLCLGLIWSGEALRIAMSAAAAPSPAWLGEFTAVLSWAGTVGLIGAATIRWRAR